MMKDKKILQLKISLDGTNLPIWRRFLVQDSITFHRLHQIIQKVMGWEDYHLYNFQLGELCIEGEEEGMICVDAMWRGFRPTGTKSQLAKQIRINELIKKEKQKFSYIYDLGDNWRHSIVVEKIMKKDDQKYPICIAGERACPPEDCGSVYGYEELMEIRKDKNHPLYQERIIEWLGEDYDPELFSIEDINENLTGNRSVLWVLPEEKIEKQNSCSHEFIQLVNRKSYDVFKCKKCDFVNKVWKK